MNALCQFSTISSRTTSSSCNEEFGQVRQCSSWRVVQREVASSAAKSWCVAPLDYNGTLHGDDWPQFYASCAGTPALAGEPSVAKQGDERGQADQP
jgi:hypothetical protein